MPKSNDNNQSKLWDDGSSSLFILLKDESKPWCFAIEPQFTKHSLTSMQTSFIFSIFWPCYFLPFV